MFCDEIPVLKLFSTSHNVDCNVAFTVDSDVQLVCKYLRAHTTKMSGKFFEIDKLYKDKGPPVKFSSNPHLSNNECHKLLLKFMPKHVAESKIMQQLFIR